MSTHTFDGSNPTGKPGTNVLNEGAKAQDPVEAMDPLTALRKANDEVATLRSHLAKTLGPAWRAITAKMEPVNASLKTAINEWARSGVAIYREQCELLANERKHYRGRAEVFFDVASQEIEVKPYRISQMIENVGQAKRNPTFWTDAEMIATQLGKLPDWSRLAAQLHTDAPGEVPPPKELGPGEGEGDDDDGDDDGEIEEGDEGEGQETPPASEPDLLITEMLRLLETTDLEEATARLHTILKEHTRGLAVNEALRDQLRTLQSRDSFTVVQQDPSTPERKVKPKKRAV